MTSDRAFTYMFSFRIFFQEWTILNLVDVPLPGNRLNSPSLAYIGASISCFFFFFAVAGDLLSLCGFSAGSEIAEIEAEPQQGGLLSLQF